MKCFPEEELHACQHLRVILEIRLHAVVKWLRLEPGELPLALLLDMQSEGGEIMNNHHRMNTAQCRTQLEEYCALHQPLGATGLYQATRFSAARTPSLHILAVVATCHLRKELPANNPSSCRSSRIIILRTRSIRATRLQPYGLTNLEQVMNLLLREEIC